MTSPPESDDMDDDGIAMAPLVKIAVGIVGTSLLASLAWLVARAPLLSTLGTETAEVMIANGITDGRVTWQTPNGWTWRVARIAGTADSATRERTRAAVAAIPGVHAAIWIDDPNHVRSRSTTTGSDRAACQRRIDALLADEKIAFGQGDATITQASTPQIDAIAQTLQNCPGLRITVVAHTGAQGSETVAMALSTARADAVASALAQRGIEKARLVALGKGRSEPLNDHDDADADRQNQRVELQLGPAPPPAKTETDR